MENYERKWQILYAIQGGRCPISGRPLTHMDTDLHHAGVHDSKWAKRRWPNLIDSAVNLMIVNHDAHMTKPKPRTWPDWVADEIEATLEDDAELCAIVNCRADVTEIAAIRQVRDLAWTMAQGRQVVA